MDHRRRRHHHHHHHHQPKRVPYDQARLGTAPTQQPTNNTATTNTNYKHHQLPVYLTSVTTPPVCSMACRAIAAAAVITISISITTTTTSTAAIPIAFKLNSI
uniref:Uncharacterized protein n=1 Tax=Musca domestica TaxID=7370 RepID=A0A1I8M208_MUSDO